MKIFRGSNCDNYTFGVTKAQPAIQSFTATTSDCKSVDFKWSVSDNVNNIAGFIIYNDDDNQNIDLYNDYILITSWSLREYEYEPHYNNEIGSNYSILAVFSDGSASALSETAKVNILDTVPPDKPDGLMLISRTRKSISVAWTESKDNCAVKGYAIYKNGQKLIELTGDELNKIYDEKHGYYLFKDISLIPNTQYSYTVRAFDYSEIIPKTAIH